MKPKEKSQVVPSWAVAFVVLATAGVTVFAMVQAGYRPEWGKSQTIAAPSFLPWSAEANDTLANLMPVGGPAAAPVAGGCPTANYFAGPANPMPPMAAAPNPLTPIAMAPVTAAIDGTNRPPAHGERGVCLNCHSITDAQGRPVPPIQSLSPLPHAYRGVCVNCHGITSPSANAYGAVQPAAAVNPVQPNAAAAAPKVPTEGEWLGLEVAPITPLTSAQFKIAECTTGLLVVEAEAQALTVGLKAGDVLIGINNMPVTNMTEFMALTKNGTLPSGVVQVVRKGQTLMVELSQTAQPAPAPAAQQPRMAAGVAGPPLRVQP